MGSNFSKENNSVDSRRRRHFFDITKRLQRISIVILAWMIGMSLLYGVYIIVFEMPYFKVQDITVKGDIQFLTKEDIVEKAGINIGDHLLRIPVKEVQKKLSENPWIKESAVHRKFPRTVLIYITENRPEAIVSAGKLYYVDKFGNPFKELSINDEKNFPVITGLESTEEVLLNDEFKSKIVELLKVRTLYEDSLVGQTYGLSEIHSDPNRGVSIITLHNPTELRLGFGPFNEKIERLQFLNQTIRSHGGIISYIDLRAEGKAVVKYGT